MLQEVKVTNALEKEIQPDNSAVISIDAYRGCQLQCPYCFQMNDETWSRKIQIRTNIPDVLKEELKSLMDPHTELFIGSLSDPYMDIEKEYGLTRKILQVLKDTTYHVFITTKAVNGLILRDLKLLKSFQIKPVILLGLSHIAQAHQGAAHPNIRIAAQLQEAGIPVRVFLTPILPDIMDVEAMVSAVPTEIPVYLDKLRVFQQGNQHIKMYEWVKKHYPVYAEHYARILFEGDEQYYRDLAHKYRKNPKITFMSELWNENEI